MASLGWMQGPENAKQRATAFDTSAARRLLTDTDGGGLGSEKTARGPVLRCSGCAFGGVEEKITLTFHRYVILDARDDSRFRR